jgi:hypothetical protein
MLQWRSQERPDFIELEQILKDLMRMDNCRELLKRLLTRGVPDLTSSSSSSGGSSLDISDLYKSLY